MGLWWEHEWGTHAARQHTCAHSTQHMACAGVCMCVHVCAPLVAVDAQALWHLVKDLVRTARSTGSQPWPLVVLAPEHIDALP